MRPSPSFQLIRLSSLPRIFVTRTARRPDPGEDESKKDATDQPEEMGVDVHSGARAQQEDVERVEKTRDHVIGLSLDRHIRADETEDGPRGSPRRDIGGKQIEGYDVAE